MFFSAWSLFKDKERVAEVFYYDYPTWRQEFIGSFKHSHERLCELLVSIQSYVDFIRGLLFTKVSPPL